MRSGPTARCQGRGKDSREPPSFIPTVAHADFGITIAGEDSRSATQSGDGRWFLCQNRSHTRDHEYSAKATSVIEKTRRAGGHVWIIVYIEMGSSPTNASIYTVQDKQHGGTPGGTGRSEYAWRRPPLFQELMRKPHHPVLRTLSSRTIAAGACC